MTEIKFPQSLLALPAELIHHILTFLTAVDLSTVGQTCRLLHDHSADDRLWKSHLQDNLPGVALSKPVRGPSFRQVYLAHHPYWFLPRNKIWFSDSLHHGKILIARYSPSRGVIEAHALVAERRTPEAQLWSHKPDVLIHTFSPRVQLNLDQPVVKIAAASARNFPADNNRFQREIMMDIHNGPEGAAALFSMFMLARSCPPDAITPQTAIWPPLKIPAFERTRNSSVEAFRGTGHRPGKLSDISEHAFRIRKWMEFTSHGHGISMRVGEDVNTYSTLPAECYTPTKKKPWRGIWVGDYAGHGCEFLVVLQPDEPIDLPTDVQNHMEQLPRRQSFDSDNLSDGSWYTAPSSLTEEENVDVAIDATSTEWMDLLQEEQDHTLDNSTASATPAMEQGEANSQTHSHHTAQTTTPFHGGDKYSGQLLAVKLTGDLNVPRGEYTFVAPDLGPFGTIRIADEEMFRGSRIVRSYGHIASTGFIEGELLPVLCPALSRHASFY